MTAPLTANRILWALLASIAVYFGAFIVIPYTAFREVLYSLAFGMAITILTTWGGTTWRIVRRGATDAPALLVLSIWLMWWVFFYSRALALLNLYLDRPQWLYDSPLIGVVPYMIVILGALQLVAAGRTDGAVPGRYWYHLLAATFIGGIVAGVIMGMTWTGGLSGILSGS